MEMPKLEPKLKQNLPPMPAKSKP